MPFWQNFPTGLVQPDLPSPTRPRFSLTSDIISFRKCVRQYGYFGNDGFVPARSAQVYFGQIIHQVLDRCHWHFRGRFGHPANTMPTDADIDHYFDEVNQALRAHGIRPVSPIVADQARQVLKTFNTLEGPVLYPRVIDTEYRLESDRSNYVLRGVVDVLTADSAGAPEIWDYKGTDMPTMASKELQDYEWQMSVYAELYKAKAGRYPVRAVLYFLNELKTRPGDPPITARPVRAVHVVDFLRDGVHPNGVPVLVQNGLTAFDTTANSILGCKQARNWPAPAAAHLPDQKTCDICDIRWNCPSVVGRYPLRPPI
jgi:hypothetical protein